MSKQRISTRNMAVIAMFSAVSFVAVLISRVIPDVAGFLSYDPKDAVIVIAGFIMGPMASVAISVIVSFIEMITISSTGPYGFLMNVVSTCAFAVPAAWFYKKHRSQKGAVVGLVLSVGLHARRAAANLAKGGINAGLALLLYRPIVSSLRKAGLVEQSSSGHKKTFNAGFTLFVAAVIVTFVLLLLVLLGVL